MILSIKKNSQAPFLKSAIQEKPFIVYWIKQYAEKIMLLFQRLEKLTTHALCYVLQNKSSLDKHIQLTNVIGLSFMLINFSSHHIYVKYHFKDKSDNPGKN